MLSYANAPADGRAPRPTSRSEPEKCAATMARSPDDSTAQFSLRNYMQEFRDHIQRVLTVLPRRH